MIFIMKELNFLFLKAIIAELKDKISLALMCSVKNIIWFILFMYQIKNLDAIPLKIVSIYC